MKVTIEPTDKKNRFQAPKITIETPHDELTAVDFVDDIVRPMMFGLGYTESTINTVLGLDMEE